MNIQPKGYITKEGVDQVEVKVQLPPNQEENVDVEPELTQEKTKIVLTKEEKKYLAVVFLSYLSGEMVWWYFLYTMLLTFTIKGADESKLSLITLNGYPNVFKFLVGPIIDTYYIKRIGARKTYLIFMTYTHMVCLIVGSFYINDWLESEDVLAVTLLGLLCNVVYIFKVEA